MELKMELNDLKELHEWVKLVLEHLIDIQGEIDELVEAVSGGARNLKKVIERR